MKITLIGQKLKGILKEILLLILFVMFSIGCGFQNASEFGSVKKTSGEGIIITDVKDDWFSNKKCIMCDIEKLHKKLLNAYSPKGNFEKTEDYIRRIAKIKQPVYCVSIDQKSKMRLSSKVESEIWAKEYNYNDNYNLTYDPDSEVLNIEIEFHDRYEKDVKVYCMSVKNTFDIITYELLLFQSYELCFKDIGGDFLKYYSEFYNKIKIPLKIPLEKARLLFKDPKEWKLFVAFVPIYIVDPESPSKLISLPAFDDSLILPTSRLVSHIKGINASIIRIWLYNSSKHKQIILYSARQ